MFKNIILCVCVYEHVHVCVEVESSACTLQQMCRFKNNLVCWNMHSVSREQLFFLYIIGQDMLFGSWTYGDSPVFDCHVAIEALRLQTCNTCFYCGFWGFEHHACRELYLSTETTPLPSKHNFILFQDSASCDQGWPQIWYNRITLIHLPQTHKLLACAMVPYFMFCCKANPRPHVCKAISLTNWTTFPARHNFKIEVFIIVALLFKNEAFMCTAGKRLGMAISTGSQFDSALMTNLFIWRKLCT